MPWAYVGCSLTLGFEAKLEVHSDAVAAVGIARRRGVGKAKHLDTADLYPQVCGSEVSYPSKTTASEHADRCGRIRENNKLDIDTKVLGQHLHSQPLACPFADARQLGLPGG